MHKALILAILGTWSLATLSTTAAFADPCGENSCWNFSPTTSGSAQTPKDIQKVMEKYKGEPVTQAALQKITIALAAGVQPLVTIQALHYAYGSYLWTGPSACQPNDARLKTAPRLQQDYCLSNGVCIPNAAQPPEEKDPCAGLSR